MENLFICIMLSLMITKSVGLQCYVCSSDKYYGEIGYNNCFRGFTSLETTPDDNAQNKSYCYTEFTMTNDLVVRVTRDYRTLTNLQGAAATIPLSNCSQSLPSVAYSIISSSTCKISCDGDKCNSQTFSNLKHCSSNCSRLSRDTIRNGTCDYINGQCDCYFGYPSSDCSQRTFPVQNPVTFRPYRHKCVQCSSAIGGTCAEETKGHDCELQSHRYCSATRTTIYDDDGNVKATTITRGCTTGFEATDRCKFSTTATPSQFSYREYSCYSTCDTDNCNTNMPNGIVDGTEKIPLSCCNDRNCYSNSVCESTDTHCLSNVVYEISNITDSGSQVDPTYRSISESYRCTSAQVTKQCTESAIGDLSLRRVTCQETCQKSNCNEGWPARPNCYQCFSRARAYDSCLENPSYPTSCSMPYHAYCTIEDNGLKVGTRESVQGYPRQITRGCSYHNIGNSCTAETIRGITVEKCTYTCTTDGCNVGSSSDMLPRISLLVLLPLVFSSVLKPIFL